MAGSDTSAPALTVDAIVDIANTGLGLTAIYVIPWVMFFTGAVFPADITDPSTLRVLWCVHLALTAGSIVLFGYLLKRGRANRLLSRRFMAAFAFLLSASEVGLMLVSNFMPDMFVLQLLLVVVFSVPFGYYFLALANDISRTNLRTISLVAPLALANAALISAFISLLPPYVATAVLCTVMSVILFVKANQPFALSGPAASFVSGLRRDQTNTVLSHIDKPVPLYLLVVLAAVTTAAVLTRDFLGSAVEIMPYLFVILFVFTACYFAFIVFRRKEASMLISVAAICVFITLGHVVHLDPFRPVSLLSPILVVGGWALFECFYWQIYTGRAFVISPDKAIYVFVRTRALVFLSMMAGMGILSISERILTPSAIEVLFVILYFLLIVALFTVGYAVARRAAESQDHHACPALGKVDQLLDSNEPSKPPLTAADIQPHAQNMSPGQPAPTRELDLDEQIEVFCNVHKDDFTFTQREKEIFRFVVLGRPVENISDSLLISISTVKGHINHIYDKTGIHKRGKLIAQFEQDVTEAAGKQTLPRD